MEDMVFGRGVEMADRLLDGSKKLEALSYAIAVLCCFEEDEGVLLDHGEDLAGIMGDYSREIRTIFEKIYPSLCMFFLEKRDSLTSELKTTLKYIKKDPASRDNLERIEEAMRKIDPVLIEAQTVAELREEFLRLKGKLATQGKTEGGNHSEAAGQGSIN